MSPGEFLVLADQLVTMRAALVTDPNTTTAVSFLDDVIEDMERLAGDAWVREQRSA